LNPQIGINAVLQLNNNDIEQRIRKRRQLSKNTQKVPDRNLVTVALNADGLYKVIRTDHRGDTRGPQFETESYCISVTQALTPNPNATPQNENEEGDNVYE
jgi:hypothetical protein